MATINAVDDDEEENEDYSGDPVEVNALEETLLEAQFEMRDSIAESGQAPVDIVALAALFTRHVEVMRGIGQLYVDVGGVAMPAGDSDLREVLAKVLGPAYKPALVRGAIEYLKDTASKLDEPTKDWVSFRNKALNTATWEVVEHSHMDVITHLQINAYHDAAAECPVLDGLLAQVLPADMLDAFWEMLGYCMTVDTMQKTAFLFKGERDSGKSTVLSVVEHFIGTGNCSHVALQDFDELVNRFAAAEIVGKLVNGCYDLDDRDLRNTAMFKMITGGSDKIRVERKYYDGFDVKPYAHLLFSSNKWPRCRAADEAYFRRWLIFPFKGTIAKQDPEMLAKATTRREMSGALNKAIAGLRRLHANNGFTVGKSGANALKAYRAEIDPVTRFFEDWTEPAGEKHNELLVDVYLKFKNVMKNNSMSAREFYRRARQLLGDRVTERQRGGTDKDRGMDAWFGLRLLK